MRVHVDLLKDPKLVLSRKLLLNMTGGDDSAWYMLCNALQIPEDTSIVELTYNSKIIKAYRLNQHIKEIE